MAITADKTFPTAADRWLDDKQGMPGASPAPTPAAGVTGNGADISNTPPGTGRTADMQHGEDLFGRVVQGAHHTIDRLAESAAPHVHKLQEGVATASDRLHQRADQAREIGDEWTEALRSTVRDHPLAAVATALAVGVLLARLTQR